MATNGSESAARALNSAGSGRGGSGAASPSEAENRAKVTSLPPSTAVSASTATVTSPPTVAPPAAAPPKLRSCVICRSRKVRCDKQVPCSNCRRAGTPCVIPSADRPPRWARRLERVAHNAAAEERSAQAVDPPTAQVMERLRNLESVVKDLTSQLEQAHAAANSSTGNSPASGSSTHDRDGDQQHAAPPPTGSASSIQSHFGRLVLNDASRSRYVSSGFWSHINDELDEIKTETQNLTGIDLDSSEDDEPSGASLPTRELERPASERHAFIFRHNLSSSTPDLRELHPLPSQIPFLLDVFSENVNMVSRILHMPAVYRMARRSMGSDITRLTPANEALMFSIYYAAITSMDDDEVWNNFGSTKIDLNLRYRLGLEHALARADFLHVPDIVLVQAFTIFLFLVRRHDSPRFVWMMTGLVIRMGQSLGLQRDGTHFKDLSYFDIEMRRRLWYALCVLDVRASEDQGTEFTIQFGTFDTKIPLNINDDDIDPNRKEAPIERDALTDMTIPIVNIQTSLTARRMLTPGVSLEEQNRLLGTFNTTLQNRFLRFSTDAGDVPSWVMVVITRLVAAKMTLFTRLPVLFSTPSEQFSDEVRNKLLVAAIEVAEFNHALNAEKSCRQWRWIYQTYTHWHAIVYLLIEICRRPWSPVVDRAWHALQSPWLIPASSNMDRGIRTWVPLRKLMLKARHHRNVELERLQNDAYAARQLEADDRQLPTPLTDPSASPTAVADIFREKWRRRVGLSTISSGHTQSEGRASTAPVNLLQPVHAFSDFAGPNPNATQEPGANSRTICPLTNTVTMPESFVPTTTYNTMPLDQPFSHEQQSNDFMGTNASLSGSYFDNNGLFSLFGADTDLNMDILAGVDVDAMDFNIDTDGPMDWNNWVESARGMEMHNHTSTGRPGQ